MPCPIPQAVPAHPPLKIVPGPGNDSCFIHPERHQRHQKAPEGNFPSQRPAKLVPSHKLSGRVGRPFWWPLLFPYCCHLQLLLHLLLLPFDIVAAYPIVIPFSFPLDPESHRPNTQARLTDRSHFTSCWQSAICTIPSSPKLVTRDGTSALGTVRDHQPDNPLRHEQALPELSTESSGLQLKDQINPSHSLILEKSNTSLVDIETERFYQILGVPHPLQPRDNINFTQFPTIEAFTYSRRLNTIRPIH
jgi:hypothetical protein